MSTSGRLTILRYAYASLVTIAFAFGLLLHVIDKGQWLTWTILGLYVLMVGITLHHLCNRISGLQGRRLILSYTAAMFVLTVMDCYSGAKVLEAVIIEVPANTTGASDAETCAPINIVSSVSSIVQVILSDGLMVEFHQMLDETILMGGMIAL
jgi:hypothetical protein